MGRVFFGTPFSDSLRYPHKGTTGNDTYYAFAGADTIDGGPGADEMHGGRGNDLYYIDTTADRPIEAAGGGTDTVVTPISTYYYKWLPANVENLTVISTAGQSVQGNDLANVMTGGEGNDTLYAHGGNDSLRSYGGNDDLRGGDGRDVLEGGSGADKLFGDLGTPGTVPGTEVRVTVSGDQYRGQPEMRVLLDGHEIGRIHVTARHDIGEWQTLIFSAPGVTDAKSLRVQFVEDAYAEDDKGTVIGDRNLWVAKVEVNGTSIDALAGTLNPEQPFGPDPENPEKPVYQSHGYVLSKAGWLSFDLPADLGDVQVSAAEQDRLIGGAGNDTLEGDGQMDVAVFSGKIADYRFEALSGSTAYDTSVQITDLNPADGDDGSDRLAHVRWAEFQDRTVQLDGVSQVRALADAPGGKAFYVAPDGNDSAVGSLAHPFATLTRARDAMRADPAIETTYVKAGHYYLADNPLSLTSLDSGVRFIGLTGDNGEKAVLHGGVPITGLTEESAGSHIWTASTGEKTVYFDVSVKGERVLPALPGDLTSDTPEDWKIGGPAWELDDKGNQKLDKDNNPIARKDAFSIPADDAKDIQPGEYVQVFRHNWRWFDDILTVNKIDSNAYSNEGQYYTYVTLNRTSEPDEFFVATTEGVVYRPLAKPQFVGDQTGGASAPEFGWAENRLKLSGVERPKDGDVVAAQRYSVVTLDGADDVVLQGLVFADTLTPLVRAGQDFTGAARYDSKDWLNQAAVSIENSDNTIISESIFKNVGRAINLHDSSAARILDNDIRDLGRDGIVVRGDSDGTLIAGNTIDDVGEVIMGSAGIDLLSPGEVDHTTIIHNTITDSSGRGITTGNEKTDGANYGTRILANHIDNMGLQVGDAGAIHLYASESLPDTGTVIDGNLIRNVSGMILAFDDSNGDGNLDWEERGSAGFSAGSMGDGIYVDIGMNDTVVTNNLVDNVSNAAVHIFGASNVTVDNNYAIINDQGGEDAWGGDKFLHLQERWLSEPTVFWATLPEGKHNIKVSFEDIENGETVFVNSIEINGVKTYAPDTVKDSETYAGNWYQWVQSDTEICFDAPPIDFTNKYTIVDKIKGQYIEKENSQQNALIVLNASFVGEESTPPTFKVYVDSATNPVYKGGSIREAPTVDGITLKHNVIDRVSAVSLDANAVEKDYIIYGFWNDVSLLENDNLTTDYNILYNAVKYVNERVEAEDYVAAYDTTSDNIGGEDRNNFFVDYGVDIETCSDTGGGYNVGYIEPGEVLWYRINVPETGDYDVVARVASVEAASFKLDYRDQPLKVDFPTTGGFQTWQSVNCGKLKLDVGLHDVKFTATSSFFNLNWLDFDLNKQKLAPEFSQDTNSLVSSDPPLVADDSTRGYGLHPAIAAEAKAMGVEDLGSNGLDLWSQAGTDGFNWRTYGDDFGASAAPTGTPSGYTWDIDPSQHVVYRDADGRIQELFYRQDDPDVWQWHQNDLTKASGESPPAASSPTGYTWDPDTSQHVVYRDTSGHIQELYYKKDDAGVWGWHQHNLTEATGAPAEATGTPSGYTWDVDNSQHVVYRDINGHIQQLYYKAADGLWHHTDLTESAAAESGEPLDELLAAGSPVGYTWDGDASQHVVYRDIDGHTQELYFLHAIGEWLPNDLSESAAAASGESLEKLLATGRPTGYTWDGDGDTGQHVVFRKAAGPISEESGEKDPPAGQIQELYYLKSIGDWYPNNLTNASGGAPLAVGSPAGYSWDAETSQHVVYRDVDGHIQELYYLDGSKEWVQSDLSAVSGNAPRANSDPAGYTWDGADDTGQHVVYASKEGNIQALNYLDTIRDWHQDDLSEAAAPTGWIV